LAQSVLGSIREVQIRGRNKASNIMMIQPNTPKLVQSTYNASTTKCHENEGKKLGSPKHSHCCMTKKNKKT